MPQIEEAELLAFALAEEQPPTRAGISADLAACEECRRALGELRAVLEAAADLDIPVRAEGYGREVWERLEPRLRVASMPARRHAWRWLAAVAVLLLAISSFLAG